MKRLYYDLHTHTWHSDGTLAPTELVQRAHAAGVRVLALTDHDVTDGLREAQTAAAALDMRLIPGVEISVTWQRQTVHILGIGIDADNSALQDGLEQLRRTRVARAEEIGRRLEKKGVADAYRGACSYAGGRIVSRTHFARLLADTGHARDMKQAFKQFLTRGAPGYAPVEWIDLASAVAWIRAAGGQAVIAHPARYKISTGQLKRLFTEFKDAGGEGIEVVSGSHSRDDYARFAAWADEYAFLASAGSDFHSPENAWIQLGRLPALPDGCTPLWRDWSEH